ncbi:hypothetical protein F4859DRAFT_507739 [Xylaria cf. heliscus]|nr:hypothetical protein F4859DRAFT_507739 [Xylaria cf. heliscus]
MDPRENPTLLLPSAHAPSDLVASSTMGSSDSPKTTAGQYQRHMIGTSKAPSQSKDGPLLADIKVENMPPIGYFEDQLDEKNLTSLHNKLAPEISSMTLYCFQPTQWDKPKPGDQTKLKCQTPDARLFIESEPGYSPKSKDANDDGDSSSIFKAEDHLMWYTSEHNKWRSISAEIALGNSYGELSTHPDCVAKLIDSNLGYLIKPSKPRLVWTVPLKWNEQGALYGFPFANKVDPGQVGEKSEVLRKVSKGMPVQLVISPGAVTRGKTTLKNHKLIAADWYLIVWRHHMTVVVPDTFDPQIKPATIEGGKFLPAS